MWKFTKSRFWRWLVKLLKRFFVTDWTQIHPVIGEQKHEHDVLDQYQRAVKTETWNETPHEAWVDHNLLAQAPIIQKPKRRKIALAALNKFPQILKNRVQAFPEQDASSDLQPHLVLKKRTKLVNQNQEVFQAYQAANNHEVYSKKRYAFRYHVTKLDQEIATVGLAMKSKKATVTIQEQIANTQAAIRTTIKQEKQALVGEDHQPQTALVLEPFPNNLVSRVEHQLTPEAVFYLPDLTKKIALQPQDLIQDQSGRIYVDRDLLKNQGIIIKTPKKYDFSAYRAKVYRPKA